MRTDTEPVESGQKPAKNRKTFGKSYHNSVAATSFTIGIIQDHATDDTAANLFESLILLPAEVAGLLITAGDCSEARATVFVVTGEVRAG